jgi:pimeloyl-ACP methyl ester carboxylesterase
MWGDPAFPLSDSFVKDMHEIKSILPRATGINIPWLLLHGTKDDVVPPIESQSLITNFRSTRDLVKIEGADHSFSGEYTNQLIEAVVEWLAKKI